MEAVFITVGADGQDLCDLVLQGIGIVPLQCGATALALCRLDIEGLSKLFGWDQRSGVSLVTGLSTALAPEGGAGGRRLSLTTGGSVEGGLDELVELRLSLACNSAIVCSNAVICLSNEPKPSRNAARASGGTVFQSGSGIGG